MKKYLFIATVLLTLCQQSNKANAQSNFAPVGAEWWYNRTNVDCAPVSPENYCEETILDHAFVTGDTIINDTSASVLTTYRRIRHSDVGATPYYDSTLYLYATNDTVFVYNNIFNKFTPLYIYNVSPGDTVCLPVPPFANDLRINPYTGDTSFCFVIDSIVTKLYDTAHLKTYFTRSISSYQQDTVLGDYPSYNWHNYLFNYDTLTGYYVETIGGYAGILPTHNTNQIIYFESIADDIIGPAGPRGGLRCYHDSNMEYHDNFIYYFSCDSLPFPMSAEVSNINFQSDITLYPNPTGNSFTLSTDIPFPVTAIAGLNDMYGRCIKRFNTIPKGVTTITYDISGIAQGMYFIKIQLGDTAIQKKIVIIH